MSAIDQELLGRLTFWPIPENAKLTYGDDTFLEAGMVLRLRGEHHYHGGGNAPKYHLIGHLNELGGYCDDCSIPFAEFDGYAYISELFCKGMK